MSLLRIALEAEVSDGKGVAELEHVFYGRVTDLTELEKAASKENQEQWEIRIPKAADNASAGTIRIRKTVDAHGTASYVLTTKTPAGGGARTEVPIPTSSDNFEQFKLLSARGMLKDRFSFPVEGSHLTWEVDMYLKPEGGYHEWCKIDLEVTSLADPVPAFPITLANVITSNPNDQSEADRAQITALYAHAFITTNPAITK